MQAEIVVLPGDGIGPEVTRAAVRVLRAVGERYGHRFTTHEHLIGGAAIDATGEPLPAATLEACRKADAVLLGAVGGPKWTGAARGPCPPAPLRQCPAAWAARAAGSPAGGSPGRRGAAGAAPGHRATSSGLAPSTRWTPGRSGAPAARRDARGHDNVAIVLRFDDESGEVAKVVVAQRHHLSGGD